MGLWSGWRDIRTIVGLNEAAKKSDDAARYLRNVEEWDCFEDLVLEWKDYFTKLAKKQETNPKKLKASNDIWSSAMHQDGTTPPAKRSGGNATYRAMKLCDKYGKGQGPSFRAAMDEGLRLAQGKSKSYWV